MMKAVRKSGTLAAKASSPTDKHVGNRVRIRRMMLSMSQTKLGDALDLTFQQVQKYEKGANRIGAGRLLQISNILQVPVTFFFEGAPSVPGAPQAKGTKPSPAYVADFLVTRDGHALIKAFMQIKDTKLRRHIVDFVEGIAVSRDRSR
jgi:transcriptional regulator with XRE-family HTH domain